MIKIGILTFHSANNFGAVLQAASLFNVLQASNDIMCEVIDYKPSFITKDYSTNPFRSHHIKTVIKNLLRYRAKTKRNHLFDEFRNKYLICSSSTQSEKEFIEVCNSYDKIIVGSDQVWNYRLTENDHRYFLDEPSISSKKYAYAVSTGDATFSEMTCLKLIGDIRRFERLSVREESSKRILQNKLERKNVEVVLDPVFLTSRQQWLKMAIEPSEESYILFFKMGYSKKADPALQFAKELSKKTGYKLKLLWDQEMWFQYQDVEHIGAVGPSEFIGWIANAKCIVTNSFHATAFSIILNIPFFVETEIDRKDRVLNLLNTFNLKDNGLKEGKTCDGKIVIPNIEWIGVNDCIETEKKKSLQYIRQIVED